MEDPPQTIDSLYYHIVNVEEGVNSMLLVLCGALVFIMHAGFAMVGGESRVRAHAPYVLFSAKSPRGPLPYSSALAPSAPRTQ